MFDIEKAIWGDYFAAYQESRDGEPIGPSGVGACYRQQAYSQLGAAVTNPQQTGKADAGSLIHLGITAIVKSHLVHTDVPVHISGLRRDGSADVVVPGDHLLIDVKTYGDRAYNYRVDAGAPYAHQWDQCELYGLGLYDAAEDGEIWTLQILAINRDTGEHEVWEKVQDLDRGIELARTLEARQDAIEVAQMGMTLNDMPPERAALQFPREGKGPGRGFPCDWCPFMDECWPAPIDASLSVQSATIVDDPDKVAQAAADYRRGADMEAEGKRIKYDASAFLTGIKGTFGGWTVSQSRPGKDTEVPDVDAMVDWLVSHGETVPTLIKPGRAGYPRVSRAKQVKP